MTGKKTGAKNRKDKFSIVNAIAISVVCVAILALAGFGWVLMQQSTELNKKKEALEATKAARAAYLEAHPYPKTLVNDSVEDTVKAAAANGWIPCPGDCLKLSTPGWHRQDVAGHPPTDWWFSFRYPGGWRAYSQHHIGHLIRTYGDRPAEDVGICPICNGTGWIAKDPNL